MPRLTSSGEAIAVLSLTTEGGSNPENRFGPEWLDAVESLLDEAERTEGLRALVVAGEGKFFSNGLDTDWMQANPQLAPGYLHRVQRLLGRFLGFPVPVVAAVNGHAFGAGAMVALAADLRVMNEERGFFCFPEVHVGLPFTQAMTSLLVEKIPQPGLHRVMTTGERMPGPVAKERGAVDEAVPPAQVESVALAAAEALTEVAGPTYTTVKRRLYARTLELLAAPLSPEDLRGMHGPGAVEV